MTKKYFRATSINKKDPDDIEKFMLTSTVSGDLVAEEIGPNIYVVSNALTQKEIDRILTICRNATQEDWEMFYRSRVEEIKEKTIADERNVHTAENERNYWFDKSLYLDDLDFCESLIEKVKPFFGDKFHIPTITEIHRQQIGEGMDEHADMGHRSDLLRSAIFYINDDYEGGELYFPALKFEYKPKAGDFITFPSYEKYMHGVRPVLSGSHRYVLAGFAWEAGKPTI